METLNESKETSSEIAIRLIDAEKAEQTIAEERGKYQILANNGAIMFFVILDMSNINHMYQFSLPYFKNIICEVLQRKQPTVTLEDRINYLLKEQIYAIYRIILRGLFEQHKLAFSFLLATATQKVPKTEMDFLLDRFLALDKEPKPIHLNFLTDHQWKRCMYLEEKIKEFKNLTNELDKKMEFFLNDFVITINLTDNDIESDVNWDITLTAFQKILLVWVFLPNLLIRSVRAYVEAVLGREFVKEKSIECFSNIYSETSSKTPLVFILIPGTNPLLNLQRIAKDFGIFDKLDFLSLGQEQGQKAENFIAKARKTGRWLLLQNCHLSGSWLTKLEIIVRNILKSSTNHENFRLFLSTKASNKFPISILQNSIKFVEEVPRGLRASLLKSLNSINKDIFELHVMKNSWRSLTFGIAMFHSVMVERRKLRVLGENSVIYEVIFRIAILLPNLKLNGLILVLR